MTTTFPRKNDHLFFINKEVIVVKVFLSFQLAEVRYLSSFDSFIVDINVLNQYADKRSSISIKLLGGVV
ncbi:hypothetical protein M5W83_26735 [Paenibacillus thiaminolyticus]|uniref:Uncharacterized protein n=1 Tax=Paenibacillus thiaminolyticus TaxID=49283 RepID=A0AAP9DRH4_PANTH|nr:hypothetical protein [Paenibacillus thiaminolyticus]MCY9535519.1 hypothetical protein [Paenibacillus thiaminolyticus]MCY9601708.1 hypothetical protein [Paenibacillus thiaminolyticus]MCY9610746.1 hypothetical protein [Paenibacillus thiaminolyticus]MCY9615841.1 hypothetical protein [Paenibacillus thiaminolyticus]MCY9622155.1 hypothetical protein [Paenibacillus thiaminolyticus]